MKVARIVELNKPLEIKEFEIPKPKGSQVLVKIQSSGVCHSDIHLWEGGYEGPEGQFLKTTDRGVRYPLTPGHEIAGIVKSMGDEVGEEFAKNERVLVYPWIGDGLCPACRAGNENLCDKPRSLGIYTDGGYAEYVLVSSYRYLVKLGNDMDMDASATLPCSALTAYSAVKNTEIKPNDNVVIVGAGGLGLMAIQLKKAITGAKVIALDIDDNKLQTAKKNGADIIVNSKKEPAFYGWPDFAGMAEPVTDQKFLPKRGPPPQFLMQEHPEVEALLALIGVAVGSTQVDFASSMDNTISVKASDSYYSCNINVFCSHLYR